MFGPGVLLDAPGAVLEARLTGPQDAAAIAHWSAAVERMAGALGWQDVRTGVRTWVGGAELGLTAPTDQLFAATDVNEWAWCDALLAAGHDLDPPALSPGATPRPFEAAADHLRAVARTEARPGFAALEQEAARRGIPFRWDDDTVWVGSGAYAQAWPRASLPVPDAVPWSRRRGVPTVLVTGSNGKTTTTRLIAAMLRATGLTTGHCCTDGVFLGGELVVAGDYSGPLGALTVLADPRVEAAVLETARGGILRRGLVVRGADVAIATNVQHDHLGEYGIDSATAIAAVKLSIAKGLHDGGWLVRNAGDRHLVAGESTVRPAVRRAWFAFDPADLARHAPARAATIQNGHLVLEDGDHVIPLAGAEDIPLAAGGAARYNLENVMAAALGAWCLGVEPDIIRVVITTFGSDPADNPGRLATWRFGPVTVLTDYAHNPEGMAGLLTVARSLGPRRMILLLGQAGNRADDAIRALAAAAWDFRPDHVILKDIEGYLRGREPGEVAGILGRELRRLGLRPECLETVLPELEAAKTALRRAQEGDVVVLPVHGVAARAEVAALLRQLAEAGWRPGIPVPEWAAPAPPAPNPTLQESP